MHVRANVTRRSIDAAILSRGPALQPDRRDAARRATAAAGPCSPHPARPAHARSRPGVRGVALQPGRGSTGRLSRPSETRKHSHGASAAGAVGGNFKLEQRAAAAASAATFAAAITIAAVTTTTTAAAAAVRPPVSPAPLVR